MEAKPDFQILVGRAKDGDREAFDALVGHTRPRLAAYVHSRLGVALEKRVEIEDIVQDALLRAYRALGGFQSRGEDSFFRWLCAIAEHVILETASQHRRRPAAPLDIDLAAAGASQSKVLRRDERFDRLQSAIDSLSPDHRRVILLVRVEGLPVHEVAKRMHRSPHAVSNLLLRATRKLRDILGDTESLSLPDRRLEERGGADNV